MAKRILDVTLSSLGLLIALPIMVLIAIAVKVSSPGPVIFSQVRVGRNGKNFRIYKFRTMRVDPQPSSQIEWCRLDTNSFKSLQFHREEDPRITTVGRFLRRTSLDELPQLYNIIRGDMSLVGPRPEIPELVQYYDEVAQRRLEVLPGLTGLAQVSGRSELTMEEKLRLDLEYVRNRSFWMDLRILGKTVKVVLTGKGAR